MFMSAGDVLSVERNLLISLLKLTQNGKVMQNIVNSDAHIPSQLCATLLEKLKNETIVYVEDGTVEADTSMRIRIAAKAASLGADIEGLSRFLQWQEFEEITAETLNLNGYFTKRTVRFTQSSQRWEIDVVGCRKPIVVCIDCKHWSRGMHPSSVNKMAEAQAERVEAFAKFLPSKKHDIPCAKWDRAKFVPVILSLVPTRVKFYGEIPIVPVLMLQDFINQLPANVESLHYFSKEYVHL
jgi:Holliday junction resolvase-like predicted endonuclease